MAKKNIAVSGGFDPLHVGHLRMMQEAAQHGKLTVIINSDEWLLRKKKYVFMPWEERAELILAYDFVDNVVKAKDDDRTVVVTLEELRPDIFANGGDEKIPIHQKQDSVEKIILKCCGESAEEKSKAVPPW